MPSILHKNIIKKNHEFALGIDNEGKIFCFSSLFEKWINKNYDNIIGKNLQNILIDNVDSIDIYNCNVTFINKEKSKIVFYPLEDCFLCIIYPENLFNKQQIIPEISFKECGNITYCNKEVIKSFGNLKGGNIFEAGENNNFFSTDRKSKYLHIDKKVYYCIKSENNTENSFYLIECTDLYTYYEKMKNEMSFCNLGKIANSISHDFNNLLTIILGFCDITIEKYKKENKQLYELNEIKKSAIKAANLVKQIKISSNISSDEVVDVNYIVEDTLPLLKKIFYAKGKILYKNFLCNSKIFFSKTYLEQIIINLFTNASQAIDKNGKIQINIFKKNLKQDIYLNYRHIPANNYLILEFEDNGCGIKKEIIKKIFNPFFSTKGDKNTGLGLSNILDILIEKNCFITVECQEKTSFKIYFPEKIWR